MYNMNLQSIQANHPADRTSGTYKFIPTTQVLEVLNTHGWEISDANEVKVRKEERVGFQKHLIRLRHKDAYCYGAIKDLIPEIVMVNAHDATAAFWLMLGVFKTACSNGLIVADSLLASFKIRHKGYADELVKEAVYNIVDNTPKVMNRIEEFTQVKLQEPEVRAYGESALDLVHNKDKWNDWDKETSITNLVKPKRDEDRDGSLWSTFNVVQEKLLKGNRFMKMKREHENYSYRPRKTREVKSIDKNVRLNKALWTLTEKMAEIKKS